MDRVPSALSHHEFGGAHVFPQWVRRAGVCDSYVALPVSRRLHAMTLLSISDTLCAAFARARQAPRRGA